MAVTKSFYCLQQLERGSRYDKYVLAQGFLDDNALRYTYLLGKLLGKWLAAAEISLSQIWADYLGSVSW